MTDRMRQRLDLVASDPLLIAGIVGSDPMLESTWPHLMALKRGGAHIVELMFPFSEPMYHGPVIERAFKRALQEDATCESLCGQIAEFRARAQDTPLVVTTYYNRVMAIGPDRFVQRLAAAGADALHVVDLPWDESHELRAHLVGQDLGFLPAVAATMSPQTWAHISRVHKAHGLPVRWTGHLGGETIDGQWPQVEFAKEFRVVASMQVSSPEEVKDVLAHFGGIWISSATVWLVEGGGSGGEVEGRLTQFIQTIHQAMTRRA